MEKHKVTITVGGQPCTFYSDDSDEDISALEKRVNAVMKETAGNTVHTAVFLADRLVRMEEEKRPEKEPEKPVLADTPEPDQPLKAEQQSRKKAVKAGEEQVSVWDVLENRYGGV